MFVIPALGRWKQFDQPAPSNWQGSLWEALILKHKVGHYQGLTPKVELGSPRFCSHIDGISFTILVTIHLRKQTHSEGRFLLVHCASPSWYGRHNEAEKSMSFQPGSRENLCPLASSFLPFYSIKSLVYGVSSLWNGATTVGGTCLWKCQWSHTQKCAFLSL